MDIYREEILEHWQNPQNFGNLADFDLEAEVVNPLCGDKIKVQVKLAGDSRPSVIPAKAGIGPNRDKILNQVEDDNMKSSRSARTIVNDIRFTGSGCAISIASASILSENIKNRPLVYLKKITGEDVLKLLGGKAGFPPARLKCAFLALEAMKKAINSEAKGQAFA